MTRRRRLASSLLALACAACGSPASSALDGSASPDAGVPSDAAAPLDQATARDASRAVDQAVAIDQAIAVDLAPAADLALAAGDSLPTGAISFFHASTCPAGWTPYTAATGRTIVATVGADVGATVGSALAAAEDRTHGHGVDGGATLPSVSYVGATGGGNPGVGVAGGLSASGSAAAVSSGLPYLQLLACQKTGAVQAGSSPLPTGMRAYFETACPGTTWADATSAGYLLVAVPSGGTVGATYGGAPLGPTEQRTHTHGASGQLVTTPHGIALASGCCASGYAADGSYAVAGTTTADSSDFPYLQLRQCEKQ